MKCYHGLHTALLSLPTLYEGGYNPSTHLSHSSAHERSQPSLRLWQQHQHCFTQSSHISRQAACTDCLPQPLQSRSQNDSCILPRTTSEFGELSYCLVHRCRSGQIPFTAGTLVCVRFQLVITNSMLIQPVLRWSSPGIICQDMDTLLSSPV